MKKMAIVLVVVGLVLVFAGLAMTPEASDANGTGGAAYFALALVAWLLGALLWMRARRGDASARHEALRKQE